MKTALATDDGPPTCPCGNRITRKIRGQYPRRCAKCRTTKTARSELTDDAYFTRLRNQLR